MLGIMNAALVSVGFDEIVSEDDGTPEFRLMVRNWPLIVEAELETGLYNFTRTQATLQSRIAGKFGFDDGYVVPGDALHVRRLWLEPTGERTFPDWVQDSDAVYLDSTEGCTVDYVSVSDPSLWSANFSLGVQESLQAKLLRGVMGEAGEANQADQRAQLAFETARTNSSKSRAPRRTMRTSQIALARFARGAD